MPQCGSPGFTSQNEENEHSGPTEPETAYRGTRGTTARGTVTGPGTLNEESEHARPRGPRHHAPHRGKHTPETALPDQHNCRPIGNTLGGLAVRPRRSFTHRPTYPVGPEITRASRWGYTSCVSVLAVIAIAISGSASPSIARLFANMSPSPLLPWAPPLPKACRGPHPTRGSCHRRQYVH